MRKILTASALILAAFIAAYTQGIQRPGGGGGSSANTRNIQGGTYTFCEDSGSTDDYACTMDPAVVSSILDGAVVKLDPNTSNTTTATLDVGLGALDIFRLGDAGVLITGDILANSPAWLLYCAACDSAAGAWILTNPIEADASVAAHAAEHETGGSDLLDLDAIPGTLGMDQTNFAVTANGRVSFDGTSTVTVRDSDVEIIPISNPVTGHSDLWQGRWVYDFVVTEIYCTTKTATSTVDIEFEERVASTPDTAGTEVMGSDLQCDTNGATDNTFDNATIAAGALMSLKITAVANAPDRVRIYVTGHPANF